MSACAFASFASQCQAPGAPPPAPTPNPQARIAPATVGGGLDAKEIVRLIERSSGRITYCYEKELLGRPTLAGQLDVRFEIGADGRVTAATATGFDERVGICVADTVDGITFPRPTSGKPVQVSCPIMFTR